MKESSDDETCLLDPSEFNFSDNEWETYINEEQKKGNPWKATKQHKDYIEHDWEEKFLKQKIQSTLLGKRLRY